LLLVVRAGRRRRPELAGPVGGGGHGVGRRGPAAALLGHPQAGGGGAARGGDGGPQRLGALVGLGEQGGGAEEGLDGELAADRSGQAGEDPGVDERLGDEEDVRRTRPGEAGHGVEERFADPRDRADGAEEGLSPGEVVVGGGGAGGDGRRALADEGRGVGHGPHHRGAGGERRLERGDRHAGGDGQDPPAAGPGGRLAGGRDVGRLHGDDRALGLGGLGGQRHAGERSGELLAAGGHGLDDDHVGGGDGAG